MYYHTMILKEIVGRMAASSASEASTSISASAWAPADIFSQHRAEKMPILNN
jgi:hypothetical protein